MSTPVPEGWYADPQDGAPGAERWWNGHQWTAHTRRVPVVPPPTRAAPPAPGAAAYGATPSSPAPPTLPDGTQLAPLAPRLGAYAIDVALVWVAASVLLLVLDTVVVVTGGLGGWDPWGWQLLGWVGTPVRTLVIGLLWVGYQLWWLTRGTPSPGKRWLGLEVRRVGAVPGEPAGLDRGTALTRALVGGGGALFAVSQLLGTVLVAVDAYRMQQDPLGRPWHDQLAGTAVVRTPGLRA